MRKETLMIIVALVLMLGFSQCKKTDNPIINGKKQHIVLNVSFSDNGSKIVEDGIGGIKWAENDKIIVKQGETLLGTLKCKNAINGIFEGEITQTTGFITFSFGERNFMNQTGDLDAAIFLSSGDVLYDVDGKYEVTMTMPHAVLKLDLSAFPDNAKLAGIVVTISADAKQIASVTNVTTASKAVYVAVPAVGSERTYTFSGNGKSAEKTWEIAANVFYTKTGSLTGEAIVIEPVAPATSKFTVDSNGTTVEFAPGNLYWNGSAFKFETNQWDYQNTWNASHLSHFKWSNAYITITTDYSYGGNLFCASGFTVNGDSHNDWRTLSEDEWDYLFYSRANASNLCAWKELDNGAYKGLVILPDGSDADVMSNITTTDDLAIYRAVFLPPAGYRLGLVVSNAGSSGYYWLSSPYEIYQDYACGIVFNSGGKGVNYDARYDGISIRLVR